MANSENETFDLGWMDFDKGLAGPKLEWLKRELHKKALDHRVKDGILQIKFSEWDQVTDIYHDRPLGELGQATYESLPNDHSLFTLLLSAKSGPDADKSFKQIVLEHEDVDLPGVGLVRMWAVQSANVSAIGNVTINAALGTIVIYLRFKGAAFYRYFPGTDEMWQDLVTEAQKVESGDQEASVGSLYHYMLKVPADNGEIKCHKLDGDTWREVLPKAQRTPTATKYKQRGKK